MSVKELTFSESTQMALSVTGQSSALRAGFSVARGDDDSESGILNTWLAALKPNIALINKAIAARFVVEGDLPIPVGLTVVTGRAGSGKTRWLNEKLIPFVPEAIDAKVIRIGEPGYFAPYTLNSLLGVLEAAVLASVNSGKPGAMMIDSLLGSWFDPSVTRGFASGRGGASLGVPMLLQILGQFALAKGFRLITVLHPVFADPEVIGSGISGVSSLFVNKDTNAYIVRDYDPLPDNATDESVFALSYRRKEFNFEGETAGDLSLLTRTLGDED